MCSEKRKRKKKRKEKKKRKRDKNIKERETRKLTQKARKNQGRIHGIDIDSRGWFSPGFKEKDSANLEEGLKICIRGQFFVPNKTRRGTRLIFKCTPFKNAFFCPKNTLKWR